jgi:hypothetical protein
MRPSPLTPGLTPGSLAVLAALVLGPGLARAATDDGDAGGEGGAAAPRRTARPGPSIELAGTPACPSCLRACSQRHPLCVEGPVRYASGGALAVIRAADRAWEAIVDVLGAPAPEGDDGAWTILLRDAVDGGGDAVPIARDPLSRFDRASSFAAVDRTVPEGCGLDLALARAVARGSAWRAAPAMDPASARAESETLARLATPCAAGADDDLDFQSHPEATLVGPRSTSFERGASMFFGWLDGTFGAQPAGLVTGLWSLAPTTTATDASRWSGSPTGFDVLAKSLEDRLWPGSTLDDVFVRFGVDRSRMSPTPRVAWHVPWPEKARRLASPEPVSPTGASYVLVDHATVPAGSRRSKLRVEAEWEDYARLRWVVVKLDAAGHPTGEVPITSLDRGTRAAMTIESLDGVEQLLIVAVNAGSTEHRFDPDQGEWEPHGWLLTLEGE